MASDDTHDDGADQADLFSDGGNGSEAVALEEATRSRYLNYALSVITSRALPDVRDGLKPVHRRILYTMWQQGVTAEAKPRKCAKVVGDVMGNYHPHGDVAIYDALVRMSQPFAMRLPLIEGSGNFGSMDGDAAAAMRYTECRLAPAAAQLLEELSQNTVPFRDNYDGTTREPAVLPAQWPNLLVNGTTGIAVGMASSIPPHNLTEVCQALLKLLDNPELKTHHLCRQIQGPDFPTGGRIVTTSEQIREIYKAGQGTLRLRASWEEVKGTRGARVVHVTAVPYGVNKAQLVERVSELAAERKVPQLLDVKDLSTDEVRVELQIKKDADPEKVLAHLCKQTQLEVNVAVNLTCLTPSEHAEAGRPERCDLRQLLQHFLAFRLEVVTRRLENELAMLEKRIHILEGFRIVFDALDRVLELIRASDGKQDAAQKIMAELPLDETQTDAILELRLYRLARLQIQVVLDELETKRARAEEVRELLADEEATGRWGIVREELAQVRDAYGEARRTSLESPEAEERELSHEELIVEEDHCAIVSRDGWVKRQKEVKDLASTRLRAGDSILAAEAGSTRAPFVFFTSFGRAYTCRLFDLPATTGHGEPIQKRFKLKDGERVVAAYCLDPRRMGAFEAPAEEPEGIPEIHGVAVASDGHALRFSFAPFAEPSTRAGRKFASLAQGAEIVGVSETAGDETMIAVTQKARALLCPVTEISFLAGAGKGVWLIKPGPEDRVLGFRLALSQKDTLEVETSRGARQKIGPGKYEITSRGGKGRAILQRGSIARVIPPEPALPELV